ncbi:MAG TPA: hypothetical protein VKZ72_00330 [Acidimicrobiales bacterium]|nr:hypothetical protein [Acidimicrobiales bacterium]
MPAPYAKVEDYRAWTDAGADLPDEQVERLLRRASELLDAVVTVPFGVDADGLPTEPAVAEALRDAACAQVEQWALVGPENDIDGLAGDHVSIGGFQGRRAPSLAPRAARLIATAGLTSSANLADVTWRHRVEQGWW